MNGIFNAEFTFHNVGQGLFYTGEISSNKSIFRFVYDCGQENSNKNVCSAVDAFHSRVMDGDIGNEKPLINLLIISHFHYDHVSGLRKFFERFTVDTVVMPYLYPCERYFILFEEFFEKGNHFDEQDTWYFEFLKNPIAYLMDNGFVKRVVVLVCDKNRMKDNFEYRAGEILIFSRFFDDNTPDEEYTILEWNDFKGMLVFEDFDGLDLLDEKDSNIINRYENVFVKSAFRSIRGISFSAEQRAFWKMAFFNYQAGDISKLRNFNDSMRNKIKEVYNDEDITDEDFQTLIKTVLKDKGNYKKLKSIYKETFKQFFGNSDINNTSLILYHAPMEKICFYDKSLKGETKEKDAKIRGHLLTGDINLNFIDINELNRYFDFTNNDVMVALVPHHGSKNSWNENILEIIKPIKWVIACGFKNKYKHPHNEVCSCLGYNNIYVVNEFNRFCVNYVDDSKAVSILTDKEMNSTNCFLAVEKDCFVYLNDLKEDDIIVVGTSLCGVSKWICFRYQNRKTNNQEEIVLIPVFS